MKRQEFRHPWLWWGLGWAGIGLLLWLSLAPLPAAPIRVPSGDKIGHLLAYTLIAWWFVQLWPRPRVLALLLVALGMAIEGLQSLTDHRHADPLDVLANALGVLLGLLLGYPAAGRLLARLDRRLPAWSRRR